MIAARHKDEASGGSKRLVLEIRAGKASPGCFALRPVLFQIKIGIFVLPRRKR